MAASQPAGLEDERLASLLGRTPSKAQMAQRARGLASAGGGARDEERPGLCRVQGVLANRWLDPENGDVADLLAPYPPGRMVAYPVSWRVNSRKSDDAKLIEPEPV